ncbi:MAG TPA: heavy-metal-associated domain-containing protein [Pyrinomonadaceae bacterium]|nr:heavy-metal-associated domain-containing protein [Pyrinomonadaceae bacterium]
MKEGTESSASEQEVGSRITTVKAPEIVCGGCVKSINKAFEGVEGVMGVEVNVPAKTVSIAHGQETPREAIVEVLNRAGYSAE